jgi:hypothetical protein
VFEAMAHDWRDLLRVALGHNAQPTAAIFDSRTAQSTGGFAKASSPNIS